MCVMHMRVCWQVSVEDIIISGRVRIILKPLLEHLPIVGALQVPCMASLCSSSITGTADKLQCLNSSLQHCGRSCRYAHCSVNSPGCCFVCLIEGPLLLTVPCCLS
jgi:hypothetical protein